MKIDKFYQLAFKLLSPIHIGLNQRSYSNKTRYFIPGFTIGSAIIKNYCLLLGENIENFYKNKINDIFFSTFFFKKKEIFFPNIIEKKIGNMRLEDFEADFIEIRKSTSIDLMSLTAKEEHLFEFEYIWSDDLEIIGYIGINKESIKKTLLFKAMKILDVGAKISKGFGKMLLIDKPQEIESIKFISNDNINLVPVKLSKNIKFKGEIEALSLNRFDEEKGYGQKIEFYGYYIMPGSKLENNKNFKYYNFFSLVKE